MTSTDLIQRGYNFFVVAFLGILGGALIPTIAAEAGWLFKLDEVGLLVLGGLAVGWYLSGRHRYSRSWVPLGLSLLALADKVVGLLVELRDLQDAGDDFGLIQTLLLFVIVSAVTFGLVGRQTRQASAPEAARQVPSHTQQ